MVSKRNLLLTHIVPHFQAQFSRHYENVSVVGLNARLCLAVSAKERKYFSSRCIPQNVGHGSVLIKIDWLNTMFPGSLYLLMKVINSMSSGPVPLHQRTA